MEENKEKTVKKRQECDPPTSGIFRIYILLAKRGRKIMKVLRVRFKALQHMRDVLKEGSEVFVEYMRKKEALMKKFEAIYVYANQRYHEDTGNSFYQGLQVRRSHYPSS